MAGELHAVAGDFATDGRTDVVVVCQDEDAMYPLWGGGSCV